MSAKHFPPVFQYLFKNNFTTSKDCIPAYSVMCMCMSENFHTMFVHHLFKMSTVNPVLFAYFIMKLKLTLLLVYCGNIICSFVFCGIKNSITLLIFHVWLCLAYHYEWSFGASYYDVGFKCYAFSNCITSHFCLSEPYSL